MNATLFRIIADADPCKMDPTGKCSSHDPNFGVKKMIGNIVEVLFVIIAIVSVFMIIYAGYTMMISAGDPGKVKKGKDTLIGSIIGLVISLLAFAIVKFVVGAIM
jgi:hypothetical protein